LAGAKRSSLPSASHQPQEILHQSNNKNDKNNNSSKCKNRNKAKDGEEERLDALKSCGRPGDQEKTTCRPPVKKVKRTVSARRLAATSGGGSSKTAKRGPQCCGSAIGAAAASLRNGAEPAAEKYRSITEFESRSWLFLREEEAAKAAAKGYTQAAYSPAAYSTAADSPATYSPAAWQEDHCCADHK